MICKMTKRLLKTSQKDPKVAAFHKIMEYVWAVFETAAKILKGKLDYYPPLPSHADLDPKFCPDISVRRRLP